MILLLQSPTVRKKRKGSQAKESQRESEKRLIDGELLA